VALYAGWLFAVLGVVAWVSGQPFIFPSLGPTAFVLAVDRRSERTRWFRVIGGHAVGAVAGWLAVVLLGPGQPITAAIDPGSIESLRLAASGVVSVVVTSWGMLATDTVHPPACATTLIVSLGLLSTLSQVGFILISVIALVVVHTLGLRIRQRWGTE